MRRNFEPERFSLAGERRPDGEDIAVPVLERAEGGCRFQFLDLDVLLLKPERGEPFAPPGIGTHRAHEHNARDARRQLKRQLAGGLDKASVHAADIEQRTRDLVIEETAHAQTKAQDNRYSSDIFLIDVSEHAFLSMGLKSTCNMAGQR